MPLIPAVGRPRQAVINEFKTSLIYTASSRPSKATYIVRPRLKMAITKFSVNRSVLHTCSFACTCLCIIQPIGSDIDIYI